MSKLLNSVLSMFSFTRSREQLKEEMPAPEFNLRDQSGKTHSLADYRGRWLVLYFYPRDDTPGCTVEACSFRDGQVQLSGMEVVVLGVSTDDMVSHQKFADKYRLGFPLLSDSDGKVAGMYGSLFRLGPLKFARRHSFIINPVGKIARIYRTVNPKRHRDEILKQLETMLPEKS